MEDSGYYTVTKISRHEIRVKRSVFIGTIAPAATREEAEQFVARIRKEFHDATHNCFAYRIDPQTFRYSDDGEPAGTAGRPILQALEHHRLLRTVLVVTRYFGGIKLGTGGLARAYGQCAEDTIAHASPTPIVFYDTWRVRFPYEFTGTVQQYLQRSQARIRNSEYSDWVTLTVEIPRAEAHPLKERLREAGAGKIEIQENVNGNSG